MTRKNNGRVNEKKKRIKQHFLTRPTNFRGARFGSFQVSWRSFLIIIHRLVCQFHTAVSQCLFLRAFCNVHGTVDEIGTGCGCGARR
jgi:hypothetical protein